MLIHNHSNQTTPAISFRQALSREVDDVKCLMMNHILSADQFSRKQLTELFKLADDMRSKSATLAKRRKLAKLHEGRILATLFYEPSTRTRLSFESAAQRLGMGIISTENAKQFSSAIKGEVIEDTIRVVADYSDVIALRHNEKGSATKAATVSKVPIINAGDGNGEHPTQALLDLYTIKKEIGRLNNLTVALIGDVKNSRTIHSLLKLLCSYEKITIHLASPAILRIPKADKAFLAKQNIKLYEHNNLEFLDSSIDVLYVTRVQKERFSSLPEYERLKNYFQITSKTLKSLSKKAIIMDPLPRVHTIATDVDKDTRAAYFRQAENGLYIRMALIDQLLSDSKQ